MAVPVKVTRVPAQTLPGGLASIEMATGRFGFIVIVIALEVAGLPEAQVASEVRMQVITSPFNGV
jgi:hypothetical protein